MFACNYGNEGKVDVIYSVLTIRAINYLTGFFVCLINDLYHIHQFNNKGYTNALTKIVVMVMFQQS